MMRPTLIILLLFISYLSLAQINGRAIKISDGDTFTILTSEFSTFKIRLHGIDCPEKKQAYGSYAKTFLSKLIINKHLNIKVKGKDRYGRVLGIAYIDGKSINELLLKNGLAWHYKKYDKNIYWSKLERVARQQKIGLWKDKEPIAPWLWRKSKKH